MIEAVHPAPSRPVMLNLGWSDRALGRGAPFPQPDTPSRQSDQVSWWIAPDISDPTVSPFAIMVGPPPHDAYTTLNRPGFDGDSSYWFSISRWGEFSVSTVLELCGGTSSR